MPYDNVVFLPEFRQATFTKNKQVLYLSNQLESLALLQSFYGISVEGVSSGQSLQVQILSWKRWDLILIESDLNSLFIVISFLTNSEISFGITNFRLL